MKFLLGELNKNKSLITEHVYFDSLFEKLINYCKNLLISSNQIITVTYDDLVNFIDSHWSGKKYLNKNKSVCILFYENLDKVSWLTETELNIIHERMKSDDGMFCSGLTNNRNIGLIILNEISIHEFNRILMHEFIHFFQWNTGKSIYQFQTSVLSDKEIEEISDILNFDKTIIDSIISHIQTAHELESYCNNIFDYLKEFCQEHKLKFNKFILKAICDCCYNKSNESFKEFHKNVIKNFKQYLNIDIKFESKYIIYILLLGYFKHGFNSFKNHLFSYFKGANSNE